MYFYFQVLTENFNKFSSKIMKKETAYIDEARFRLRLE